MLEDAITQAERQLLENPEGAGLVTSSSDWHAGYCGPARLTPQGTLQTASLCHCYRP